MPLLRLLLVGAIAWLLPAGFAQAGQAWKYPHEQVLDMGRGMNVLSQDPILRWSSQPARFTDHHFDVLRAAGFCTLRVNIDGFAKLDKTGHLDGAWLNRLDNVIQRASERRFQVIVDEHNHRQCGKDAKSCRTRLIQLWREISSHYKGAPDNVMFELLNEPNTQITASYWNSLLDELLAIVRRENPYRNVIIGPASWNTMTDLSRLKLPEEDRHIILSLHYYEPMAFTHQGVEWTPGHPNPTGVAWDQERVERRVAQDFETVDRWAKSHGRPVFLGEFGAFDVIPVEQRAMYARTVVRQAESLGWAWAYWQFDSSFVAYDMHADKWLGPIRDALAPAGTEYGRCR